MDKSPVSTKADSRRQALNQLAEWISNELSLFHTPRRIDVIRHGKTLGLTRKQSLSVLKTFPSITDVGRPTFPWPRKKTRNYRINYYGVLYVDLAFFNKRFSPELRSLGVISKTEENPALIAVDGATRFAMAEPLGPKGKSTQAVLKAMNVIFDRYFAQYGSFPFLVCSDREKAIMSKEMYAFLREKGAKLYAYKFSRTKALFAENLIRNLRSSMSMLRKEAAAKKRPLPKWTQMLPKLIEHYNDRPISYLGKTLSFSPRDITEKNFADYKAEIEKKFESYSLASFSIYPGLFKWKFPIGSRVRLKRRAVQVPGIGNDDAKLSAQPLLERYIFIVKRRVVHLNAKHQLIQTLILQEENTGEVTQQPEDACVLLDDQGFPVGEE